VVTREITSLQSYFTGLLQLMNIFQRVHCAEIILELFKRLK